MINNDIKIKELEEQIKKLEEQLKSETVLRKSEVLMNSDLKDYNQKLEIQIEKLLEINQEFLTKIVYLNKVIKHLFKHNA